jgi:hypothetical protein
MLVLPIQDNGSSSPSEILPHIFEPSITATHFAAYSCYGAFT